MTEQGTLLQPSRTRKQPLLGRRAAQGGMFGLCWGSGGCGARQFHSGTVSAKAHTVDTLLKAKVGPLLCPPAASRGVGVGGGEFAAEAPGNSVDVALDVASACCYSAETSCLLDE